MRRFWPVLLVLGLLLGSSRAAAPEEPQWEWTSVPRVVAVGDIHGAYDNLVALLKTAGIIDQKQNWAGGKAHLVQNGDIVDRGPNSKKAMDLLMELEEQAEKAGGRVHVLIGNHEAMNVVGILDLVSRQEYESYTDRDSRRLQESFFDRYYDQMRQEAKEREEKAPDRNQLKSEFEAKYPLGYVEHRQAFSATGRYGKWIRGHNVSVKIDGVVYSHGDWSEKMAADRHRRDQPPGSGGVVG